MNHTFARGQQTATLNTQNLNKLMRDNHTPHFHSKEHFMRLNVKDDP